MQSLDQELKSKTDYITVIVENLYQPHNANSVIRTCESLGINTVHVIELNNEFMLVDKIALECADHLNIVLHKNISDCIKEIKAKGYKLVATTPHKDDYNLEDLPLSDKIALAFGTEEKGLSKEIIDNADLFMKIPMYGFTESLNISVTVAISTYTLINKLHDTSIDWKIL